jgi:uncharacterized protein
LFSIAANSARTFLEPAEGRFALLLFSFGIATESLTKNTGWQEQCGIEYTIARFTWDPTKAEKNRWAHGVSFETAKEVFDDPYHVAADNHFIETDGEQRYQIIGMTRNLVLLPVVFVDRSEPNTEVIHLISARKAVDYEESIYKDQFR